MCTPHGMRQPVRVFAFFGFTDRFHDTRIQKHWARVGLSTLRCRGVN